ncbi:TonB family protein [Terriglobus roseus]|nr:TonB family protein [Terriglobus roseus]
MEDSEKRKNRFLAAFFINTSLAALLIWISVLTARRVVEQHVEKTITFNNVKPPEPPKPVPPPKLPKPPIVKVEPPKILPNVPKIEVPEPPKVQPQPVLKAQPIITPAPPKAVTPPPAPKPVAISIAQAASVPNHDAHPSAVRLGSMTNPINNTTGPAVSPVNLGHSGAPGMPAGNTGFGPPSQIAIAGSGSPNGQMGGHDRAAQPIKGINTGVPGGTGPLTAKPVGAIAIAKGPTPPAIPQTQVSTTPAKSAPKVIFKPKPEYTEEARSLHLEGTVYIKIHVSASGAVSVLGVQSGLGHGLDQAAVRAVQGMRFQPAMANGQPTDWDGVVNINFQLAG